MPCADSRAGGVVFQPFRLWPKSSACCHLHGVDARGAACSEVHNVAMQQFSQHAHANIDFEH